MKPNTVIQGDALEVLKGMPPDYFDSCVTDPPYELGFMGKAWDKSGVAYSVDLWREVLRVLKPGAHLLSFGGSRTYHRMACAIEDAGFEIRDQIMWIYGSGFPKSLDISKAIEKAAGEYVPGEVLPSSRQSAASETGIATSFRTKNGTNPQTDLARQWQGWGTALKPAHEPICVARKPFKGTGAENVQRYGTGGINVDGCRVETEDVRPLIVSKNGTSRTCFGSGINNSWQDPDGTTQGRFPANVIHDGSEEVVRMFPETSSGEKKAGTPYNHANCNTMGASSGCVTRDFPSDNGSAARFFYCAKASRQERGPGNFHPTVKPLALIQYLVKLVTPPGGIILDPFIGSGTLGIAAGKLGMKWVGIEKIKHHIEIAERRIEREVGLLLDVEDAPC